MHCWKTINVKKQYGLDRLFLLSSLLVITVFSFAYVLLGIINDTSKSDDYFWIFVLAFFSIYPTHKLFHYIPLFRFRDKVRFSIKKQFGFLPIVSIRIFEPINKNIFVFSLLAPFIFINLALLTAALLLPIFAHYFTILLAYHCGMCLIDLIYVKNLLKSPKKALIEETDAGYEILIATVHT
ncbi:DUF3267 domain-containing protein [Psychrobacillus vulpis]|uniref:DUF3267 domain-containing protein n=1 Tax=Psychrobacillus vulpis TaxID=2325572 RepID=A0A544TNT0_9BACI|nr:DUF3267 domain-containing protein [Psychrobacillus vulpis]TQR19049.1 DUF3267 domain-containing protein [Psychrobacillus vulpis]